MSGCTYDEWLYRSDDEDEDVRCRDTYALEALHKMDFSMISAVRECESTQKGQLDTWDSSRGRETGSADSSEQRTRGVEADKPAATDQPAADMTAATVFKEESAVDLKMAVATVC